MSYKYKLGVIGAGFMSNAIVSGAINSNYLQGKDIIVSDINELSFEKYKELKVNFTLSNDEVFNNSEYVLLAVKPQHFISAMGDKIYENKKVISIMAGVRKDKIGKYFINSEIARCMPNTPCSVGYGAVGIDLSSYKCSSDINFIKGLFNSFSSTVCLEEDKLNIVMGVSGSSPAYFYLFLKYIIDAGVKRGLDFEDAKNLAVNTMIGSGFMVKNLKDKTLDELITAVCSKGGTTIEAINTFNNNGLNDIVDSAIDACIKRGVEIENG